MPRKPSYKTISLEGLEHIPDLSGEWTWQTPSTNKWKTYKLSESETDKTHTISYLQVNYSRRSATDPWKEDNRYRYYRRLAKYLAINGPLEGSLITTKTPEYRLYYTQYNSGSLPRKVMIHVDSMARKLGLLW